MKNGKQSLPELLDRCFARFRELPQSQIEMGCQRVLQVLHAESSRLQAEGVALRHVRHRWSWRRLAVGVAFAALVLAGLSVLLTEIQNYRQLAGAHAVVQHVDGSIKALDPGEIFRTDDGVGAVISMSDGSRAEVRENSELSVERAGSGVAIRLNQGSVIVNVTEQRTRSLYVQTKDLTVSVLGTVFVVIAEQAGSRVAVIQGEVRVQQGATEVNLKQGEQLATSPQMESRPVSDEIAWSRNTDIHLQQLQQSRKTIEERCGPTDLRSIVREHGGWNLRLPGVLWRKYKCQHESDGL